MSNLEKTSSKKGMLKMILVITTSVFLLTTFLSVTPSSFANAIVQNQNMMGGMGKPMTNNGYQTNGMNNNNVIPQINGTINLKNTTNTISIKNVSVPFGTAVQSAQNAISNGTIIGGHISVTQGFLTYTFKVSNPTNNTISKVIVDAGNGKVLYTSPGKSINSTQFAMNGMNGGFRGHQGMNNGFGGGHDGFGGGGHWKQGHWGSDGQNMNDGFRDHWGNNHNQRW
ncbi:MAG: PepSY domain-containing protein [Candidatus Nitrosocosmicus sp.]